MEAKMENTQTATTLSTQIIIMAVVNNEEYAVGAIKEFNIKQEREGENIIKSIEIKRVVFDGLSVMEVFGQKNDFLEHMPFNIRVVDHFGANNKTINTYHNCVFVSYYKPLNADDYIIIEKAKIIYEKQTTEH